MHMRKWLLVGVLILALGFLFVKTQEPTRFLVYGLEGTRTDTILLVSADPAAGKLSVLSIPRDTYHPVEGKNGLGQKKINAVYGFKEGGGSEGLREAVEGLTGLSIDATVGVRYEHVPPLIDALGGVPVEVPYAMHYDDRRASPPLSIHFEAGPRTITGEEALGYLRFRKNNDGTRNIGDLGRIERQQAFLKSALDQALERPSPTLITKALGTLETDLSLVDVLPLTPLLFTLSEESIAFDKLPEKSVGSGPDGLSYYFHDAQATETLTATY